MISFKNAFPSKAAEWDKKYNEGKEVDFYAITSPVEGVFRKKGYTDPVSGKSGIFECRERIAEIVKNENLAKTHPDIAAQWYQEKNGKLRPTDIAADCRFPVWWIEPMPAGQLGFHIWEQSPYDRTCVRRETADKPKRPSLAKKYPDLAKEFDSEKNAPLTADDVGALSRKAFWWKKTYRDETTGQDIESEWRATIQERLEQSRKGEATIRDRFNVCEREPVVEPEKKKEPRIIQYRKDNQRYNETMALLQQYRCMDKRCREAIAIRNAIDALENDPEMRDGKKLASLVRAYYNGSGTAAQIAARFCLTEANFYVKKAKAVEYISRKLFPDMVA